jgi:hypothetical protein
MPGGQRHQIAQHRLSLFLRQVVIIGQFGGQMLERDGHLRRGFRWGGGLLGGGGGFLRWWHNDLPGLMKSCNLLDRPGFDQMHRFGPMADSGD